MEKVKVILSDGTETTLNNWQKIYGLKLHSPLIGKYFSLNEARFQKDLSNYGELIVSELLIRVLDEYRKQLGQPVIINSFNRSEAKQVNLKAQGLRAATHSPHVAKLAADIDTPGILELASHGAPESPTELWKKAMEINRERVKILEKVSDDLGIHTRIGNEEYLRAKQTFIHVDVCPEYFAKGKPWNDRFHPLAWEKSITW
jgi:hypothetical protein